MGRLKYQGKSALITGASSGLGEAFARALAARGMALLLTALPEDQAPLRALADELRAQHGVRTETVAIDLAEREAARQLQAQADALAFEPDLLVNNAGAGAMGRFVELPIERQLTMLHLNVEAVVTLCGLYLPRMVARRSGAVINVASVAAFAPIPYMTVYAASKGFVTSFSQALWAECHRYGVRVVVLCPGPLADTRFGDRGGDSTRKAPGPGLPHLRRRLLRETVVASALHALEHDRPTAVRRASGTGLALQLALDVLAATPRLRLMATERLVRWAFQLP